MDQINFANILPAEIWKMIICFLLHEPGQGWPPSVWRVRRLLWPVAMADLDSLLCVTSRAFLATIYETVVKKSPILTKLFPPLALVDADEKGKNEADMIRIKEALLIFLRAETLDYILGDTPKGEFMPFFSGIGSSDGGAYIKGPSKLVERLPKKWRQAYSGNFCGKTGITTFLWIRYDPFHRPYLWVETGLHKWCSRHMPVRAWVLKEMSDFALMIARIANEIHGNMELCLYKRYGKFPTSTQGVSYFPIEKSSIVVSGSISHPVTQDAALLLAKEIGGQTLSDRGHLRALRTGSCDLGARIYCTDDHETPTGYGWAVCHDEETPRWFLIDPYKKETCRSFRLLTKEEKGLTAIEKALFASLPLDHHPIGMFKGFSHISGDNDEIFPPVILGTVTVTSGTDDDIEKPPPKKRAKLQ